MSDFWDFIQDHEIDPASLKEMSLDDRVAKIRNLIQQQISPVKSEGIPYVSGGSENYWVYQTYDDYAILQKNNDFFKVPYRCDGDSVVLGTIIPVEIMWVPKNEVSRSDMMTDGMIKEAQEEEATKGGPGSGNWGHAGRPGSVGGSAPKTGTGAAVSRTSGRDVYSRSAMAKFPSYTKARRAFFNLDDKVYKWLEKRVGKDTMDEFGNDYDEIADLLPKEERDKYDKLSLVYHKAMEAFTTHHQAREEKRQAQDRAIKTLAKKPLKKLRQMQDDINVGIKIAHDNRETAELKKLQKQWDMVRAAIDWQQFGSKV